MSHFKLTLQTVQNYKRIMFEQLTKLFQTHFSLLLQNHLINYNIAALGLSGTK